MYHDEFEKRPLQAKSPDQSPLPLLAIEVGAGVSLGLLASLNQAVSVVVYGVGGLWPLLVTCGAIAYQQGSDSLARLVPTLRRRNRSGSEQSQTSRPALVLSGPHQLRLPQLVTRVSTETETRHSAASR
jgi:hypothetical protein